MNTVDLTAADIQQTLAIDPIVSVDVWASRIGPSSRLAPPYEKVAAANPNVVLGNVDTETEQALAVAAGISPTPTLMGVPRRHPGVRPARRTAPSGLVQVIEAVQELDMDQVRATHTPQLVGAR